MEEAVPERRRTSDRGGAADLRRGTASGTGTKPVQSVRGAVGRGRQIAVAGFAEAVDEEEAPEEADDGRMKAADLIAPSRLDFIAEQRGRRRGAGQARRRDRLRQPEGRRRQDDDDPQPRRRLRRVRLPRALHRPRPAGQPDDEPGNRPRQGREEPLRRARQRHADPRDHRRARDRHRRRLDRPGRRRDRDEHQDRPRALAGEGAEGGHRRLRLRLHRHAAEPRPADDQRADGREQGDRPRPVRVSLDARAGPAPEHAEDDPGEPQPRRPHRGHPADDARLADRPRQGGGGDPRRELRRPRLPLPDPQGDQIRRGAGQGVPACSSTIPAAAPRTTTGSWRRRFWRMARRKARKHARGPPRRSLPLDFDDAPVDPPRYGREDPAEARKAQDEAASDEATTPAGAVAEADASSSQAAGEEPASTPPAAGGGATTPSARARARARSVRSGGRRAGGARPAPRRAPERLKRVFSEEPRPRVDREEFLPGTTRATAARSRPTSRPAAASRTSR